MKYILFLHCIVIKIKYIVEIVFKFFLKLKNILNIYYFT